MRCVLKKKLTILVALIFIAIGGLSIAPSIIYNSGASIDFSRSERYGGSTLAMLLLGYDYSLQKCCSHSTSLIDFDGAYNQLARRFEVKPEDPKVKNGYRSELRLKSDRIGDTVQYSGRMFISQELIEDNEYSYILMQWHGTRDYMLGEKGREPPLGLAIRDGEWRVGKAWDTRLFSKGGKPEGKEFLARIKINSPGWVEWKFEVLWSTGDEGRIRAWLNGQQVIDNVGPNCHNDFVGPYLKAGIYPDWRKVVDRSTLTSKSVIFDSISAIVKAD